MKIRWILFDMDLIKKQHLTANMEYWKQDTILEAQKVLNRIGTSRIIKTATKGNQNLWLTIEGLKHKADTAINEINKLINYEVLGAPMDQRAIVLELFIDSSYFNTADIIEAQHGRLIKKLMKTIDRQRMIDAFEEEIMTTYTPDFYGEILEDDGHGLTIREKK